MIFITLERFRARPTKEMVAQSGRVEKQVVKESVKILGSYWTLGRYDSVLIFEAEDEKAAMKALIRASDIVSTETLIAMPREEALKLLE